MRAAVDRTIYLTYGIEQDELPVLLASGCYFRYTKEGSNALVFNQKPERTLTISGFVWAGNTERLLSGTSYLIDESVSSGHIILLPRNLFSAAYFVLMHDRSLTLSHLMECSDVYC